VARTGITGFFIGNSAESVLSSVNCGMLTVKPHGFETPISPPDVFITGPRNLDTVHEEVRHIN